MPHAEESEETAAEESKTRLLLHWPHVKLQVPTEVILRGGVSCSAVCEG